VREPRVGPLQRLMKHGAATAASDAGLGRQADIVCVCVPDEDQVNGVLFGHDGDPGVLAGLRAGGIVAVHSTVSPARPQKPAAGSLTNPGTDYTGRNSGHGKARR
jgi:3-hydroxyisobutyrate dehydrogenase-like beta-hydroxyacid dehydrogenase